MKKQSDIERIKEIKSFIVRYISMKESERRKIYYVDDLNGYVSEISLNVLNSNTYILKET